MQSTHWLKRGKYDIPKLTNIAQPIEVQVASVNQWTCNQINMLTVHKYKNLYQGFAQ